MTGGVRGARAELVRAVAELERIFVQLGPLARAFTAAAAPADGTPARREDLAVLRPAILDVLAAHRGSVTGAGVITVPGLLADAPRWLEWWWTSPVGVPEALRVNLDESAPDFFDYTIAEWYAVPMRSESRYAAGPYVDYFCTNEYTITFALPVRAGGRPVGVAAADVLVAGLERRLVPILRAIGGDTVLTSAEGRVIASATPRWSPGERLPVDPERATPVPRVPARRVPAGMHCWLVSAG